MGGAYFHPRSMYVSGVHKIPNFILKVSIRVYVKMWPAVSRTEIKRKRNIERAFLVLSKSFLRP